MNPNETSTNHGQSDAVKRQLTVLKQAPVFFNNLDLIPSECSWYISIEDMEKYMRTIAGKYLGDEEVRMVTIERSMSRAPYAYVWLNRDSKHLVDTSKNNDQNLAITPRIDRYSDQLKKFGDMFAPTMTASGEPINPKKRIRLMPNKNGDRNLTAIMVDINRFISRMFDDDNRGFIDAYPGSPNRPCRIKCTLKMNARDDRRLVAIQVTKKFDDIKAGGGIDRPVAGFRDMRNDRDDRSNGYRKQEKALDVE